MKFKCIRYFLLLLLTSFLFTSCLKKIVLNATGVFKDHVPLKYITNGEKRLVFFPMHHIGKKVFYNDVKNKIDSLKAEGFTIYYEAVHLGNLRDSLQKDTLYLKARKITGIDFATATMNKGYIDTSKNTLLGIKTKYIAKYHLINQPKDIILMSDSLHVKNVDGNFVDLMNASEKKFGPIELDQYDYKTKFGEKYKLKKNKELFKYFVEGYRNTLISTTILNDKNNKIILIYGSDHFKGILENLKQADPNFKQVDKL